MTQGTAMRKSSDNDSMTALRVSINQLRKPNENSKDLIKRIIEANDLFNSVVVTTNISNTSLIKEYIQTEEFINSL